MLSLSSPSDSEASNCAAEIEDFYARIESKLQEPQFTPDSSECLSDIQPSDTAHSNLYYQKYRVEVPKALLDSNNLFSIFNKDTFDTLPTEEKNKLLQLLPSGDKNEILEKLFNPESTYFRSSHPVKLLGSLLNNQYFTNTEHMARKVEHKIYLLELKKYLTDIESFLAKWQQFFYNLEESNQVRNADHYSGVEDIWKDQILSDPESIRDFNSEIFCKENSLSEEEEFEPELSESFEDEKITLNPKKDKKKLKSNVRDELDDLMSSDRFVDLKLYKNQVTIKPRSEEWINEYRQQEFARYSNPTRPWIYYNEDTTTSIVAPVSKKSFNVSSKPREHIMLKNDRPACITILCLARDAASRLPDGIGTRADICDLIKDSQYLAIDISEANISNIVSGALDRLHYEKDPCVRYDTDRKIWIYLHRNRTLDYQAWEDPNSGTPNSLEICSLKPSKLDESENERKGERIVIIKLDEVKSGKRDSPEMDSEDQMLEDDEIKSDRDE